MKRFPTISGTLYFGPVPSVEELKLLQKANIDLIWNLAREAGMIVDYEKQFVPEVLFGDIGDFDVPSDVGNFLWQLKKVVGVLKGGGKVMIHCGGGKGRVSLALAAIDLVLNGKTAEQALARTKSRASGPETILQQDFIRHLSKHLRNERFLDLYSRQKKDAV